MHDLDDSILALTFLFTYKEETKLSSFYFSECSDNLTNL